MSYGKVEDVYWESDKIAALSDRAALFGLFLITGPHRNLLGCFRLGLGAISDVPRWRAWGPSGINAAFDELIAAKFLIRDAESGWTLITKALEFEPIASPNAAKGAVKLAHRIPRDIPLYRVLFDRLEPQLRKHKEVLSKASLWPLQAPTEGPCIAPSEGAVKPINGTFEAPSEGYETGPSKPSQELKTGPSKPCREGPTQGPSKPDTEERKKERKEEPSHEEGFQRVELQRPRLVATPFDEGAA